MRKILYLCGLQGSKSGRKWMEKDGNNTDLIATDCNKSLRDLDFLDLFAKILDVPVGVYCVMDIRCIQRVAHEEP